jgi:hypothetical protein
MKQPSNKETIKRLYNEYKEQYLNEIFETPLEFKQIEPTKYQAENLAIFIFKREYNFLDVPFDTNMYKVPLYWSISWVWNNELPDEEKTLKNWLKVMSTSFKIVDNFIRQKEYPLVLEFSGQTETHKRVYHNKEFLDRWQILFGEKYEVILHKDHIWFINKNISNKNIHNAIKLSEQSQISLSKAIEYWKFKTKRDVKGISRHDMIKEQIKRIILKRMYLR